MKRYLSFFSTAVFCLALFCTSCKTSEEANSLAKKKEDVKKKSLVDKKNTAQTMAELLRRQPLLTVSGSDNNPSVQIRGKTSFNTTTEPLYIVDGRRMGHNFSTIAAIAPADVEKISVVRDPAELAAYGVGAANGVIEIQLKQQP
ncbi:MAG: TonB-dependent receptor plug domain-containing protein [Bacteroidota bacterium]